MKLDDVEARLGELDYDPLTSRFGGRLLYGLIVGSRARHVLELGFAHGTSTAYIAAALDEVGGNLVTTIDRRVARSLRPNIEELLDHLALGKYVNPIFSASTYTWELMRLLEQSADATVPLFDLCFVDGAHTWSEDGFAFLLADKLLADDAWIVFDDVNWTLGGSPSQSSDKLAAMPEDERSTAQVSKVFELLVRQHPAYDEHRIVGDYACAHKRGRSGGRHRDLLDTVMSASLGSELALAVAHEHKRSRQPSDTY